MLRTVGDQPSLWESLLPAEALVMPVELEHVDRLLDDERFFAPYREFFHASFGRPLATTTPEPRIIQVDAGAAQDRTAVGRAWVGDSTACDLFQRRFSEWPHDDLAGLAPSGLVTSMQWLVRFAPVPTVGGDLTQVVTTESGFRYVAGPQVIGPEQLHALACAQSSDTLTMRLQPVPCGDRSLLLLECAVGVPPTYGALAYLATPPGYGVLFRHDLLPHKPVSIAAQSLAELADIAWSKVRAVVALSEALSTRSGTLRGWRRSQPTRFPSTSTTSRHSMTPCSG